MSRKGKGEKYKNLFLIPRLCYSTAGKKKKKKRKKKEKKKKKKKERNGEQDIAKTCGGLDEINQYAIQGYLSLRAQVMKVFITHQRLWLCVNTCMGKKLQTFINRMLLRRDGKLITSGLTCFYILLMFFFTLSFCIPVSFFFYVISHVREKTRWIQKCSRGVGRNY